MDRIKLYLLAPVVIKYREQLLCKTIIELLLIIILLIYSPSSKDTVLLTKLTD